MGMNRYRMDRRRALVALAALAACKRQEPPPVVANDQLFRRLDVAPTGEMPDGERALVMLPPGARELPVLVALHGRGESGRGLDAGADAWPHNYQLDRIHARLLAPPINSNDLHGMASADRL